MNVLGWIIALILGLAIGAAVTWWYSALQRSQAQARIAELEASLADGSTTGATSPGGSALTRPGGAATVVAPAALAFDAAAAKAALGRNVTRDDLTLIDGIGPKIAALLAQDGVDTWLALSKADTARLQRILDVAGPRYRTHRPDAWPRQAGLLAAGRFEDFAAASESMRAEK